MWVDSTGYRVPINVLIRKDHTGGCAITGGVRIPTGNGKVRMAIEELLVTAALAYADSTDVGYTVINKNGFKQPVDLNQPQPMGMKKGKASPQSAIGKKWRECSDVVYVLQNCERDPFSWTSLIANINKTNEPRKTYITL